jgi:two-component sensor histidine kinase
MDLMWSQVAKALDPQGAGVYEVEYRVKQLDGTWRWLSAWGLVEFDGSGAERRPVAISGASRDLTERKEAEELQRLMVNELNHRVKNSLATVQSIAMQTLRGAGDTETARHALDQRICSLARAHDLLTARNWAGAALGDVVAQAVEPFVASRFAVSGPALDVRPRHALALSMALHELATNAVKYGALSVPDGVVRIAWRVEGQTLVLHWREAGGPPVSPPSRRGFGSRLLERSLVADLGGHVQVDYAASGVVWEIAAKLSA